MSHGHWNLIEIKESIRDILKQLCSYKGVEIIEGHLRIAGMYFILKMCVKAPKTVCEHSGKSDEIHKCRLDFAYEIPAFKL